MITKDRIERSLPPGMTSCLILLIALQLTSVAAHAGSRIEVNTTAFDFGHMEEGLPAVANVVIKNVGDRDAIIEDAACS